MNKSESIKNLSIALSKFQGEVKNPPNSANNPFFKSKYAPLDVVINTAKEALAKYNLSFIQLPGCDGEFVTCTTILMLEDEYIESEQIKIKLAKTDVQSMGAAITYIKRYQLSAMLGLASEEDKDGADPSGKGKKLDRTEEEIEAEKAEKLAKEKIDVIKVATIKGLLKSTHTDEQQFCDYYKVKSIQEIPNVMYAKVMAVLTKKKEGQPPTPQQDLDI